MNVPAEKVRRQIASLFAAWGMDAEQVRIAAEVMVETDLSGVDSHGVSMLMMYEGMHRDGQLMLNARPTMNTGMASARLGPMRARISAAMSRLSSARPKSKANSLTDFS